jgi:probable F420-dependent oxidoreductase
VALTFGCVLTPAMSGPLASPDAIRSLAQQAEALGFESVWVADHIVVPRQVTSSYPYAASGTSPFNPDSPFYEPLSVLNFLAGCTQRIRLGTHVLIVPYRHPVFTAKILATLDVLSGGRLILGAGVGWMEEEFKSLALDSFRERGAVTNEYLRLFKELWTKDQPNFQGKYFQVSGIGFQPKPVQKPHPPIWTGGHTEPALKRAAALADGWMPIGLRPPSLLRPEEFGEKVDRLRTLIRQAGRAEGAVTIAFTAPIAFIRTPGKSRPVLTGSPEEIAGDLRQYSGLGVQHFNFNLPGNSISEQQEAMDRVARDVIPLIARD